MAFRSYALVLTCPNKSGIVARISATLFKHGADIFEAQQFDDASSNRFFTRMCFRLESDAGALKLDIAEVAQHLDMTWRIHNVDEFAKVVLMVSKFDHCLSDLLYRWRLGDLPMHVVAIISNHPLETFDRLDFGDVPFHYLPVSKETKADQEKSVLKIVADTQADLVVLARYMQILSVDLTREFAEKCINIHHSFLPSFKGAKPYHQAFERGVKVIGATAHYVTSNLDEGPIIEQDVERISHADTPEDLIRKGRDIERRVLARALRFHLEHRVLINGARTVVFRD